MLPTHSTFYDLVEGWPPKVSEADISSSSRFQLHFMCSFFHLFRLSLSPLDFFKTKKIFLN